MEISENVMHEEFAIEKMDEIQKKLIELGAHPATYVRSLTLNLLAMCASQPNADCAFNDLINAMKETWREFHAGTEH